MTEIVFWGIYICIVALVVVLCFLAIRDLVFEIQRVIHRKRDWERFETNFREFTKDDDESN